MKCEECAEAEATVKLTDMIGGQKRVRHLCEGCCNRVGYVIELPKTEAPVLPALQIAAVHLVAKQIPIEEPGAPCLECGFAWSDFAKNSRLGCPEDYDLFEDQLRPLLERYHGASDHRGSEPESRASHRAAAREALLREQHIQGIQAALDLAVREERYEEAAALRDELRRASGSEADATG